MVNSDRAESFIVDCGGGESDAGCCWMSEVG